MTTARNEESKAIKRKPQSPPEGELKEKKAKLTHKEEKSILVGEEYEALIKKAENDIQGCEHEFNEIMIACSKSLSETKPDTENLIAQFHNDWKRNLDKKIAYYESVKQEIDKNHKLSNTDSILEFRSNSLLVMREAYLGIKDIISNNLIEAKNHFKRAIKIKCGFVLPELWLAITYYRLGKYAKTIEICSKAISKFYPEVLEKISTIYTLFPSMREKIEDYNLNFTHQDFCYSEFFYYRACQTSIKIAGRIDSLNF